MIHAFQFTKDEARELHRHLAVLPDPAVIAAQLPAAMAHALRGAYHTREGCRVADPAMLGHLRLWGLAEINGPYLSNFGTAVRRALMEG